ncbi:MAG: hypothetical protein J3K34DRAFT_427020 [Monoraphidium minutum]|nr:MAG: hypothetical protein J3K34DRAFT_427020 [Monoraphidium minutum]
MPWWRGFAGSALAAITLRASDVSQTCTSSMGMGVGTGVGDTGTGVGDAIDWVGSGKSSVVGEDECPAVCAQYASVDAWTLPCVGARPALGSAHGGGATMPPSVGDCAPAMLAPPKPPLSALAPAMAPPICFLPRWRGGPCPRRRWQRRRRRASSPESASAALPAPPRVYCSSHRSCQPPPAPSLHAAVPHTTAAVPAVCHETGPQGSCPPRPRTTVLAPGRGPGRSAGTINACLQARCAPHGPGGRSDLCIGAATRCGFSVCSCGAHACGI